jgi:hypothetical protein
VKGAFRVARKHGQKLIWYVIWSWRFPRGKSTNSFVEDVAARDVWQKRRWEHRGWWLHIKSVQFAVI